MQYVQKYAHSRRIATETDRFLFDFFWFVVADRFASFLLVLKRFATTILCYYCHVHHKTTI